MKNLSSFILLFLFCTQVSLAQKPKLGYMTKVPMSQVYQIAKYEDKPVMIFIHSFSCYSSRKYIREIMNQQQVIDNFKNHFVCVNADMATSRGRQLAMKYNALILPVIILINSDQSITYRCQMKIDEAALLEEVRNFVTVNKVQKQIVSYMKSTKSTHHISADKIGASYAKIDYKKNPENIPGTFVKKYTMSISDLKPFEEGYLREWDKLKNAKPKDKEK